MLNLITALTNGTVEYKENGEMVTHPPTALMLRAARALKEVATVNESNNIIIQQLQQQLNQAMEDNARIRQNQQQASNVESGNQQSAGGDTSS